MRARKHTRQELKMKNIGRYLVGALVLGLLAPGCGVGDDPVYMCKGKPVACPSRTPTQCELSDCHVGGTCGGTPAACAGLNITDCAAQEGCSWNYMDGLHQFCEGTPNPCSEQTLDLACSYVKGCTWTKACTGSVSAGCEVLREKECGQLPGCSWTNINE